jgi:hypothetical protein
LIRVETEKRDLPPLASVPWKEHPRVVRAYDLLSTRRAEAIAEIKEFRPQVWIHALAPDAGFFVIEGISDEENPLHRKIKVLSAAAGTKELLPLVAEVAGPQVHAWACVDPPGKLLALTVPDKSGLTAALFEMPSGKILGRTTYGAYPSAGAKLWFNRSNGSIYRELNKPPLVTLDLDESRADGASFNFKGTHVAWSNRDGTVAVCDLEEVQRRLAELVLGW